VAGELAITPELLLRYAGAGPRYTSYPTAPRWSEDYPLSAFHRGLRAFQQIDISRVHLGGGTPTWLDLEQLARLYEILYSRFRPVPGAEISVEADPEVTTSEQLAALSALGVNRMSFGGQSFDPVVLKSVNRPQERDRIRQLVVQSRELGMGSLNLDLIYGLPHQSAERFGRTLDEVISLRPDRLAVFGYAYLPWLKPHMKKIEAAALPGPLDRAGLYLLAQERLQAAGYRPIGLDHFALEDDELSLALEQEALHRNFMGYTTMADADLIGLGMSAISELGGEYVQQRVKLAQWWRAVEGDAPLIEKGCVPSAEDRLRKDVIYSLMCNLVLRPTDIEARHGVDSVHHFAPALAALVPMAEEGLVSVSPEEIRVTELGRLLVRNIAMAFDPHLQPTPVASGARYSQTV
jgi:oxygen-independent coproporphyrinogen-3 oxidase